MEDTVRSATSTVLVCNNSSKIQEMDDSPNGTPDPNYTVSCVACDRPPTADNFVCCDRCADWWHMSCAGVTDSIENKDWLCSTCLPALSISITSTSSTRRARLQLELQRLTEQRELEKLALNVELEKRFLERKYAMLEKSLQDEEVDHRSNRSRSSKTDAEKRKKRYPGLGGTTIE